MIKFHLKFLVEVYIKLLNCYKIYILIIFKELKCSVCTAKAVGVCALCMVVRYCKACFNVKHKDLQKEDDPNNIHKLTYYVIQN